MIAFLAGVLAALGLGAVALIGLAVRARRRFIGQPDAFSCRIRTASPTRRRRPLRRAGARWPHRWLGVTGARWVRDVLVVQSGLLGLSVTALAARIGTETVLRPVPSTEVRGLGRRPWAVVLSTEDGDSLEIAVGTWDRDRLVGPYLTAALSGLPSAPHEHGV